MARVSRWLALCGLMVATAGGCMPTPQGTRLKLVTYDEGGKPSTLYSDFSRASFRWQTDNRIEVVFRAQVSSHVDPTQMITQVVYIQTFWAPRLGTSNAEKTQINARVQYGILTPPTGIRYDGGAFVTYKFDPLTKEATGWIETGDLAPAMKMGNAVEPFGPARISGTFRATENGGDVVNTSQMLKTQFTQLIEKP